MSEPSQRQVDPRDKQRAAFTANHIQETLCPIASPSEDGPEDRPQILKPYPNQRAMEACLKAHPGLTEEEFKEMAEKFGF